MARKVYRYEYTVIWNPVSWYDEPGKIHIEMRETCGRRAHTETLCGRDSHYWSAQRTREHPKGPNIPDTPDPAWARGEWGDLDPEQFCSHCWHGWTQIVEPEPEDWDGRVREVVG